MTRAMEFTAEESRLFFLHVISTTLDERTMLKAWRLFRSKSSGPLFRVEIPPHGRIGQQPSLNFEVVVCWALLNTRVTDIVRLTNLSRGSVQRHLAEWRSWTKDEQAAYRATLNKRLERFSRRLELEVGDYLAAQHAAVSD